MEKNLVEAINYEKLRVRGYNLEYIKDLKITSNINEHATLNLTGVLKTEQGDMDVFDTNDNKTIEVYYDENNSTTLFYGIVTNIEVSVDTEVYIIKIEAKSMTYLMDIKLKSRSFQNTSMSTHDFVRLIMSEYGLSNFTLNIPDEPLGELIIQYEETDWELLKRILSKYNMGIFPIMSSMSIGYVMGTPDIHKDLKTSLIEYEVYKDIDDYEYMSENYLQDAQESDYVTYKIKSYEILNLGDNTTIDGHKFYVYSAEYEINNDVLENIYTMRIKNGLRQKRVFNTKVVGTSISGKIIDVKNDVVRIHLDIDEKQDKSTAYWFKFSTMSASNDGSGWYCMPEIGDSVRAYFPTKDEDETFAISAVSGYKQGAGEAEDRMGNPDNKYLRTSNDKQVTLKPDGIAISCDSGQADMNLSNDGTLTISSQNNITITAKENVKVEAGKSFLLTASQGVNISCDKNGGIMFDESGQIKEMGVQVNNNYE